LSIKHVAEGANVAEEVISTVRTAQAFGTQDTLARKYEDHAVQARVADTRVALFSGIGLGAVFFVIYASDALSE
jgi:ATP-binding cassette, subfamily B (MDR/TAP), member 1